LRILELEEREMKKWLSGVVAAVLLVGAVL
jgi:hypothetical protein